MGGGKSVNFENLDLLVRDFLIDIWIDKGLQSLYQKFAACPEKKL